MRQRRRRYELVGGLGELAATERGSRDADEPRATSGVAVAVVHAADGVRHLVAAHSGEELIGALADYVRRRAGTQLWPRSARRVLDLLERGRAEAAVRLYFALTGSRWDQEHLTLRSVELR
jgi:hypothetical protein